MKDVITLAYPKWLYEAKEYEHKTGMKGIAHDYRFPQGMMPYRAFYHFHDLMEENKDRQIHVPDQFGAAATPVNPDALEFINELVALNPELSDIRYNAHDPGQAYDLVAGAASKLNVDDIDFFLNEWSQMLQTKSSEEHIKYQKALAVETGFILYCIGSPKTHSKIKDHFGLSAWKPTEEDMANLEWKFERLLHNEIILHEKPDIREFALNEFNRRVAADKNTTDPFELNYKGRKVKVQPYEPKLPSIS